MRHNRLSCPGTQSEQKDSLNVTKSITKLGHSVNKCTWKLLNLIVYKWYSRLRCRIKEFQITENTVINFSIYFLWKKSSMVVEKMQLKFGAFNTSGSSSVCYLRRHHSEFTKQLTKCSLYPKKHRVQRQKTFDTVLIFIMLFTIKHLRHRYKMALIQ